MTDECGSLLIGQLHNRITPQSNSRPESNLPGNNPAKCEEGGT